mgnify:FL=1
MLHGLDSMNEIPTLDPRLNEIEKLIVVENMTIEKACVRAKISKAHFYEIVKRMSEEEFRDLFARAREVRGLELLDDCLEAFKKMKETDDNKEAWKQKNIIDQGLKLAGKLNQALSDKIQNQTNVQVNNFGHDEFVMKKLEK